MAVNFLFLDLEQFSLSFSINKEMMTAGPVLLIKVSFIQSCREFLGGSAPAVSTLGWL